MSQDDQRMRVVVCVIEVEGLERKRRGRRRMWGYVDALQARERSRLVGRRRSPGCKHSRTWTRLGRYKSSSKAVQTTN